MFLSVILGIVLAFDAPMPVLAQTPPRDPKVESALKKGETALTARKYQPALDAFKQAYQLSNKSSAAALWGAARAYHGAGSYKNEAAVCLDALNLAAGDPALEAAFRQSRGVALYMLAESNADRVLKDAEAEFRAVLLLPDPGPVTHYYLGMTLLRQGGNDDEGLMRLRAAIDRGLPAPERDLASRTLENPRRAGASFAPAFTLTTREGEVVNSEMLSGKTVLLDFWGTWCGPCRASTPGLVKLNAEFAGPSFAMISISSDAPKDQAKWAKYIDEHQMHWLQSLEIKRTVIPAFNVHSYPTFVVIDADGIIRLRMEGFGPGTIARLERAIDGALKR